MMRGLNHGLAGIVTWADNPVTLLIRGLNKLARPIYIIGYAMFSSCLCIFSISAKGSLWPEKKSSLKNRSNSLSFSFRSCLNLLSNDDEKLSKVFYTIPYWIFFLLLINNKSFSKDHRCHYDNNEKHYLWFFLFIHHRSPLIDLKYNDKKYPSYLFVSFLFFTIV